MVNEKITPKGTLVITLTGPDGQIKDQIVKPNMVVDAGKRIIASAIASGGSTAFNYMAFGVGGGLGTANAPALGDVALQSETASSRIIGTPTIPTGLNDATLGYGTAFTVATGIGGTNTFTSTTLLQVGQVLTYTSGGVGVTIPAGTVVISVTGAGPYTYITNNAIAGTGAAVCYAHSTSVVYSWTWGPNNPVASGTTRICEAGIFNAATGVTMLSRVNFSEVDKVGGADSLSIQWIVSLV